MKQIIKRIFPQELWGILSTWKYHFRAWLVGYDPKKCMNMFYRNIFHIDMNWENPQNLIEKINWLQLNTDTSLWTRCADKYEVRGYVQEKGCGEILNELYGVWERVEDIEWDKLPNLFVLKTTQGCGEVLLVKDKSQLDRRKVCKQLDKWLKEKYGIHNGQTHYTRIHPRIIAEKLLINAANPETSLVDYKIWCFNGEPEFVLVVHDRKVGGQYLLSAYDLQWNDISEIAFNKSSEHYSEIKMDKPSALKEMIETAKILSKGFSEVRVDFYEQEGKPIFGEMTFTTGFGYFNMDYYNYLGSKIDINKR